MIKGESLKTDSELVQGNQILVKAQFKCVCQYVTPSTFENHNILLKAMGNDSLSLKRRIESKSFFRDKVFTLYIVKPKESEIKQAYYQLINYYNKDRFIFLTYPRDIHEENKIIICEDFLEFKNHYLDSMVSY
jgi:hypothetical protein